MFVGWACMIVGVCLWALMMVRMTRANEQASIPWLGRPPNRSTTTSLAQALGYAALFGGLFIVAHRASEWQFWLAFGITGATAVALAVVILVHNDRVKYGE
jgi:FtsH-binding integral membrane protein